MNSRVSGQKLISILGLGWLGEPLALRLQADGHTVIGSKTSSTGVSLMEKKGISSYLFNATENFYLKDPEVKSLFKVDALIITLPPQAHHPLIEYYPMIRAMVKTARYCGVKRLIFTSSISIYGDQRGVLNENSETTPISNNGKVLKQIENYLTDQKGLEINVLRLGGLIGAERHPVKSLSGRTAIKNPNDVVNLVHQDDVINVISNLVKSDQYHDGTTCFNLVAPKHPKHKDYYQTMATKLDLPLPLFEDTSIEEKSLEEESSKTIMGNRIMEKLGIGYLYPDPYDMPFTRD